MDNKKYYVGLDMGTDSVGWAVTDTNYVLERAKGKDMWGARLFSAAKTAAKRRKFRIGRRRRQREVARINYLKMCFSPAIEKIDSGFIHRLDESKYFLEDRSEENKQKFALFNDKEFNDKDYFKKYKTIFHLRAELLEDNPVKKHDVRLVYLALLNMFKHRGNFLYSSLSDESDSVSMKEAFSDFVELANILDISFPQSIDTAKLEEILGDRGTTKIEKLERITKLIGINKKDSPASYELMQMWCGQKGKMINIFPDVINEENKNLSISFSDTDFDEKIALLSDLVGEENTDIIFCAKEIHDIGALACIMKGYRFLSQARVAAYDKHNEDLKELKAVLKEYDKDAYEKFFRIMQDGNYSAYVGSVNSDKVKQRRNENKGRSQEELYKTIKDIFKKLPESAKDDARIIDIQHKMEIYDFLPKQLTASNGIIPNQVHAKEMRKILDNASTYLDFLNDKDESGLTVKERILRMFTFCMPYFVGPIGQSGNKKGLNSWAERIEQGKVYPWNLAQKIDLDGAAEKFIVRMLRNCTYMDDQKALPKQSLLYEKFQVLNELNNLKIHGEKISVELKQDIYNNLFMKGKKVTNNKLFSYLVALGKMGKDEKPEIEISGIDGDFKNYLSSVNKFAPILGAENVYGKYREMIEQTIFWGTVYGDNRKLINRKIKEKYPEILDDEQIKRISGFKFSGWGKLSKKLLEMPGKEGSIEEDKSIIISMWESNENFMELLSGRHTYRDEIDKTLKKREKELIEWEYDDLNEMYLSPSVKRMTWQTIRIMQDICSIKGHAPARVFVEMPREDGEKNKRTESRKAKLKKLYKGQKDFLKEIDTYEEKNFKEKKLYLYCLQNKKSMYTGKPIDLENLLSNNSRYDIDHIYPRHYVKDDSLDNNLVLVEKEINNDIKGGDYPLDKKIQDSMICFWRDLLNRGFMTKEKFDRLTRITEFTEQELADFIARQLVETRQGTKAITQILKSALPDSEIVFTKAGVVSTFRQKFNIPKVRSLNSCHHAHDAYLNIVAGNVYYVKFTANPLNFIIESRKRDSGYEYRYHMDKVFEYDVRRNSEVAWVSQKDNDPGTIKTIKKMLAKTSVLLTNKSYIEHGGIFGKATLLSAKIAGNNSKAYFPVKTTEERLQDVSRYGGVTSISNAAYALVQYNIGDETIRALIGVPIYLGDVSIKSEKLYVYLKKIIEKDNSKKIIDSFSIRRYPIRQGTPIIINGYRYILQGATKNQIYLKNFISLYLLYEHQVYLKKIEKAVRNKDYSEIDKNGNMLLTSEENISLFKQLKDKLSNGIYLNRLRSIREILQNGMDEFTELSVEKQCAIIMQIIYWFNTTTQTIDLSELKKSGGSKNGGKLRITKKVSKFNEVKLIDYSPTGLIERRIDLLKI